MKTVLAVIGGVVVARKVAEVLVETYRVGLVWKGLAAAGAYYASTSWAQTGGQMKERRP